VGLAYITLASPHVKVAPVMSERGSEGCKIQLTEVSIRALSGWGISPGVLATQKVDTGLPVAGVAPIEVVVAAGTSGVEQVPPGEDAVAGVWAMCLPTIVRVGTRTKSTGAVSTVLVEIVPAR
jgi:hypothetical protein